MRRIGCRAVIFKIEGNIFKYDQFDPDSVKHTQAQVTYDLYNGSKRFPDDLDTIEVYSRLPCTCTVAALFMTIRSGLLRPIGLSGH
jgi:hypothetical protein